MICDGKQVTCCGISLQFRLRGRLSSTLRTGTGDLPEFNRSQADLFQSRD